MKKLIALILALLISVFTVSCTNNSMPAVNIVSSEPETVTDQRIIAANAAMQSIFMPCSIEEITSLGEYVESTQYLTDVYDEKAEYTVTYSIEGTDYLLKVFADNERGVTRKQLVIDEIPKTEFTRKKAEGVYIGRSLADLFVFLGEGLNIMSYQAFDENGLAYDVMDFYVWQNEDELQFTALISGGAVADCMISEKGDISLPEQQPAEDEHILPQIVYAEQKEATGFLQLCEDESFAQMYDSFCMINYGATASDIEKLMGQAVDGEETQDYYTKQVEQDEFKATLYFAKEGSDLISVAGAADLIYQAQFDYELPDDITHGDICSYTADMLYCGMDKTEADAILGFSGVYTGLSYDAEKNLIYRTYRYDSDCSTVYVYYDYSPEQSLSVRKVLFEEKDNYKELPGEQYISGENFVFVG